MEEIDRMFEESSAKELEDAAWTRISDLEGRITELEAKLEEAERRAVKKTETKEADEEEAEREETEDEPEPEESAGEDATAESEEGLGSIMEEVLPVVAVDAAVEGKWEKSKKSVLRGKWPLPSSNLTKLPEIQKVEAQADRRIDQEFRKQAQRAASQAESQTAEDANANKEDLHVAQLLVLFSFPIAIYLVRNPGCWECVRGGGAALAKLGLGCWEGVCGGGSALANPLLCAETSQKYITV